MDHEYIKQLLERYFEGETSISEEKALKEFFKKSDLTDDLKPYQQQFSLFSKMGEDVTTRSDDWLMSGIKKPEAKQFSLPEWTMRIAAGILLVIAGFGAGKWYEGSKGSVNPLEISSLKKDVREMKMMLTLTQMQQASASERIQAVSQSTEIKETNEEIIEALISTLNADNNVNVRLAACDALFKWREDPLVRKGLIQSLRNQRDPSVQVTIIDMLVAMKEKGAITEMQKLSQERDVMAIVKTKAITGVSKLL